MYSSVQLSYTISKLKKQEAKQRITVEEYAQAADVSRSAAQNQMDRAVQYGLLIYEPGENGRGRYYLP